MPNSFAFCRHHPHLLDALRIRIGFRAVGGGDVVVDHGQRLFRRANLAPGGAQPLERLRRGHLVNQMAIDIEQAGAVIGLVDQMVVPDLSYSVVGFCRTWCVALNGIQIGKAYGARRHARSLKPRARTSSGGQRSARASGCGRRERRGTRWAGDLETSEPYSTSAIQARHAFAFTAAAIASKTVDPHGPIKKSAGRTRALRRNNGVR